MRILLIDDSPLSKKMTQKILDKLENKPEVILANGGQQGLALFDSKAPDIVLCDLLMPDMDGMEIVKRIRAQSSTAFLVILSSDAQAGRQKDAAAVGVNLFVKKPLNQEKIEQLLTAYKKK